MAASVWLKLSLLSIFCLSLISSDEDMKGFSLLNLEHSFGNAERADYIKRGTVTIQSLKSGEATFEDVTFSEDERESLKALVQEDGDYRVRLVPKNLPANVQTTTYASSFVKACLLYESRLQFVININVDPSGNVLGMSLRPTVAYCTGERVPDQELSRLKTSVEVVQTTQGPQPETHDYIKKMEEERAEKAKGHNEDNRSFFSKYWMYLVPLVIILMFASGDPNTGGAGGGGGGR